MTQWLSRLIVILLFFIPSLLAQKVIVSDASASAHADSVKSSVYLGFGSNYADSIEIHAVGLSGYFSLQRADSTGAILVVRSTTGITFMIDSAQYYHPDVLVVMPMGSNSYVELSDPTDIPVIVTTGAGDAENETAYGNGLEFFDVDSIYGEPDASSFANGLIAGKLLAIKVGRGGSWWDARYAARETASNGGTWDKFDGYGKIDVTAAIAFAGEVPVDPYIWTPPDPLPPPPVLVIIYEVYNDTTGTRVYGNPNVIYHAHPEILP